ncbi:translation initiation factor eIF-2B subunit alpha, putative [Hepatocystis sp. ex Piliocolobus tephrosceles]|nr:translation initiation factor eIF-2B subunit alpha, putative [Hepatocystis sp. ex Piliocolobus tephrosceles]
MDKYNSLTKCDVAEEHEVIRNFKKYYFEDKYEMHIASLKSIEGFLKNNLDKTTFELFIKLNEARSKLYNFIKNDKVQEEIISMSHSKRMTIYLIISVFDIYHNFVVKKYTHNENNFSYFKNVLLSSASEFTSKLEDSLHTIEKNSRMMFTNNKTTILTHSNSECVKRLLLNVKNDNKKIIVYFTSTEDINNNYLKEEKKFDDVFIDCLKKENIEIIKMNINQAKNIFYEIDFVLIGTELVIDNGGIVSKRGIKLLAELCLLNKKEFYVACESFKFLKTELIQDISDKFYSYCTKNISMENHTLYEYIPHNHITLFYTDIGILPPSSISFELNKLYMRHVY